MTQRKRNKKKRPARAQPPPKTEPRTARQLVVVALASIAVTLVVGVLLWRSTRGGESTFLGIPAGDPGPVHVHGLGVNPADGALFIATHTGLYRVGAGERQAKRVGNRRQDTMGFSVAGPNRFLGSGHPDFKEAREKNLPPLLGLIESDDSGQNWRSVSLLGEADFHVLRFSGERVYGYDATNERLLSSADRGQSWKELDAPGPLVDLAVDPRDARHVVVAVAGELEQGLFEGRNRVGSWKRVSEPVGLLAWPTRDRFYLVTEGGQVFRSADGGRRFRHRGEIGGRPAALLAGKSGDLYVALHDGTIKRSVDGGSNWSVRSKP